jgi:hypothetical protein
MMRRFFASIRLSCLAFVSIRRSIKGFGRGEYLKYMYGFWGYKNGKKYIVSVRTNIRDVSEDEF